MSDYVHVRDEPRHRHRFENAYARVYDVLVPPGDTTLYHEHTEDTLYVAIHEANVEDQTYGEQTTNEGRVPAGIALCRQHRDRPLIHRVTNVGAQDMRMIGLEVKASPPHVASKPLADEQHELVWEKARLRVYSVSLPVGQAQACSYDVSGAWIFLTQACLEVTQGNAAFASTFEPGAVVWMNAPTRASVTNVGPAACTALLAEWL